MIQVGARNMQNFELLKELGKLKTPILLKRGLSNTLEEFLMLSLLHIWAMSWVAWPMAKPYLTTFSPCAMGRSACLLYTSRCV